MRSETDAKLDLLADPWAAYRRVQRSLWVAAPHAERRYFRTQDHGTYQRDRRLLIDQCAQAVRKWQAACRRVFGRSTLIEPVGEARGAGLGIGMPACFLVRVPKAGEMLMREFVFGKPIGDDRRGAGRVRELLARQRAEQRSAKHDARVRGLTKRLYASVARGRDQLALKQAARHDVDQALEAGDELAAAKARMRANNHHALASRAWASAGKMQRRLAALGYVYDIATLDTGA